jgi:hypothetical protein
MEEIFKAITNFGFPVVISIYLLVRFEGKIDKLEQAIKGENGLIVKLNDLIDEVQRLCRK